MKAGELYKVESGPYSWDVLEIVFVEADGSPWVSTCINRSTLTWKHHPNWSVLIPLESPLARVLYNVH